MKISYGVNIGTITVDTLNVDFPTVISDAENLINEFKADPPVGQANNPGHIWAEQYTFRKENPTLKHQVNLTALNNAVQQQNNNDVLRQWLSAFYTIRLDGRTRFSLAESKLKSKLLMQLPLKRVVRRYFLPSQL